MILYTINDEDYEFDTYEAALAYAQSSFDDDVDTEGYRNGEIITVEVEIVKFDLCEDTHDKTILDRAIETLEYEVMDSELKQHGTY